MALSWVHENIRAFGGDPDQVTMYGESSGSSSVFLQSVSVGRAPFSTFMDFDFLNLTRQPLSAGLVHRAIAQSGGNLGPGRELFKKCHNVVVLDNQALLNW